MRTYKVSSVSHRCLDEHRRERERTSSAFSPSKERHISILQIIHNYSTEEGKLKTKCTRRVNEQRQQQEQMHWFLVP